MKEYIEQHQEETQRLLGLKYSQLQELITQAERIHSQKKENESRNKPRLIKSGGGRQPKLCVKSQILLTLVYLHHVPTFQMLGVQFRVSESAANYIFHYWVGILRELLPASLLEQVKKNENEELWVKEILTEFQLIVDSYEQPRYRPTDYQEQKKCYSGKKKSHTFKNQLIVTPNGQEIVDIVVGETGPTSDINIWRSQREKLKESQRFQGDKAYTGEAAISTPHKKPKNQVLADEKERKNREQAKRRVIVEHLIRLVKIFRVAGERFRLKSLNYEAVILAVCGLVRWRIGAIVFSN